MAAGSLVSNPELVPTAQSPADRFPLVGRVREPARTSATGGTKPVSATPPTPQPSNPPPPDFLSEEDLEDADDILRTHAPMRIATVNCTCGAAYPCTDVQWARLITQVAEAGR
ncbi:hypothetical protein [Micromonospora sp. NBC_01796]|uniref:hypothetical protein n=1 Tax=Micromonospora sp. NBC_01796 TaxID=2975987 RepID=UPI002DD8912E|nr:hypothetical protein [Micromonospora sp. NBC_01796]WSA83502.1 hypothetical protein OIE47_24285 [Micromonospora sp. NBC_01796]